MFFGSIDAAGSCGDDCSLVSKVADGPPVAESPGPDARIGAARVLLLAEVKILLSNEAAGLTVFCLVKGWRGEVTDDLEADVAMA